MYSKRNRFTFFLLQGKRSMLCSIIPKKCNLGKAHCCFRAKINRLKNIYLTERRLLHYFSIFSSLFSFTLSYLNYEPQLVSKKPEICQAWEIVQIASKAERSTMLILFMTTRLLEFIVQFFCFWAHSAMCINRICVVDFRY